MTQSEPSKKPQAAKAVTPKPEVVEEVVKEEPPAPKSELDKLIERLRVEKPEVFEQYRKALRQRRPAWIYPDLTVRIG
tara:strand:+ start:299 stop:532 length:234 start_codon:yes stop_codon:yes gene_type:complete